MAWHPYTPWTTQAPERSLAFSQASSSSSLSLSSSVTHLKGWGPDSGSWLRALPLPTKAGLKVCRNQP